MILAERLCVLGFDPESGRERAMPGRDVLHSVMAGLMLADLIRAGRVSIDADRVEQRDALPLAHPLLSEAASLLARQSPLFLQPALRELHNTCARWRRRMHMALAERDILELQVPFPFLRRYRLRSRLAWNESADLLREAASSPRFDRFALTLATHRCGWLADVMDATEARQLLARIAEQSAGNDHTMQLLPTLFAPA